MSSQHQLERLKKHMTQSRLTYTDEWLIACYEWVSDSNSPRQLTEDFIQNEVYMQWLEGNLEDMESRCLPPDLKDQRLKLLTGTFALQINSVQDIGESAYSQYNKIKKLDSENTTVQATDSTEVPAWQTKPRRALYLSMTDGSQKVYGLEVESLPSLSLAIKPGYKILITGPVDCRRGILHLKPQNVKPLGGSVEAFLSQNSAENILCKILKKPTTSGAESQQSAISGSQIQQPSISINSRPQQATSNTNFSSRTIPVNTQSQASFHSRTTQPLGSQHKPTLQHSRPQNSSEFNESDNDEFLMDIDESILLAPTASTNRNIQSMPTQTPSTQGPSKSNAKTIPKSALRLPPLKKTQKPAASNSDNLASSFPKTDSSRKPNNLKPVLSLLRQQKPASGSSRTNSNAGFNSSDDELFLMDEANLVKGSKSKSQVKPSTPELITLDDDDEFAGSGRPKPTPVSNRCKIMPAAPYQYIRQITSGNIKTGSTVYVKAIISTLTSNIEVDKTTGEWKLSANINDGSGFLVARIAPAVLDKIIGFSPTQMKQLKTSKSIAEKEKVRKGMLQLTKTLVHFTGVMKIKTGKDENLILEMSFITNDHVHELLTRTSQFAAS